MSVESISPLANGNTSSKDQTGVPDFKNPTILVDESQTVRRRPCCRCCCPFTWKKAVCLAALLTALAVALFFVVPRAPYLTAVSDPYAPAPPTEAFSYSGFEPSLQSIVQVISGGFNPPLELRLAFSVDMTAYSPNYYDIPVDRIEINGSLVGPDMETISRLAFGGASGNLVFKRLQNINQTLAIQSTLSISSLAILQDPAINLLIAACSVNSTTPLKFRYAAAVHVSVLKTFGILPTDGGIISVKCPKEAERILALFTSLTTASGIAGLVGGIGTGLGGLVANAGQAATGIANSVGL